MIYKIKEKGKESFGVCFLFFNLMRFWKSHAKVTSKAKLNFVSQEYKFWVTKWVVWEVKHPVGTWGAEKGQWF